MNVAPFKALTPGYVDLEETEPVFDSTYQPLGRVDSKDSLLGANQI